LEASREMFEILCTKTKEKLNIKSVETLSS